MPEKAEALDSLSSDKLRNGASAFRNASLRLLAELDDGEARMNGPVGQLDLTLEINDFQTMLVVPSFARDWRAMWDRTGHRWGVQFPL